MFSLPGLVSIEAVRLWPLRYDCLGCFYHDSSTPYANCKSLSRQIIHNPVTVGCRSGYKTCHPAPDLPAHPLDCDSGLLPCPSHSSSMFGSACTHAGYFQVSLSEAVFVGDCRRAAVWESTYARRNLATLVNSSQRSGWLIIPM